MKVDIQERILIIRLSSIGDILLSSPFVRQVKKHFPNSKIDYLIKEQFSDLMRFNPHLNKLHILTTKNIDELKNLRHNLKTNSFQIIFDLHNNLRSNFLKRGIGAHHIRSINKNKVRQLLLVKFKLNYYRVLTPIPERYLHVASDFDIEDDNQGLELYWQSEHVGSAFEKAKMMGLNLNENYVCLAPGAAHFTKRWPIASFLQLSEKIEQHYQMKRVILGGQSDKELGKYLSRPGQVYDLTGQLSLLESAVILSKAVAAVTNDSGLMHMATAVKVPVLALFGSTVREFGFFPFRGEFKVLENRLLSCRPCTHIGRKSCPKKHFDCMLNINSSAAFHELERLVSKSNRRLFS